LMVCNEKCRNS